MKDGYSKVISCPFVKVYKCSLLRIWERNPAYVGVRGLTFVAHFITGHENTQLIDCWL